VIQAICSSSNKKQHPLGTKCNVVCNMVFAGCSHATTVAEECKIFFGQVIFLPVNKDHHAFTVHASQHQVFQFH
jgi:hypothetical protein